MALQLADKQEIVSQVAEIAANALSVIGAEYRGLTVEDMTKLRIEAREAGVTLRVVRNTLAKRAMQGTPFECITDELKGPLVLAFANDEPGSAARVIKDFAQGNDKLVVRIVAMDGKLMSPEDIDALASLPTYDQAISLLMSVMLAPITKFVRTMAEPHAELVRVVAAVRDKKQAE